MFKFFAAVLATATLALAAWAPAPRAPAGDATLTLSATLRGPMGFGRAMYEERPSTYKVTQVLAVRVIEAEPDVVYKVFVNGSPVGEIATDAKGCGRGYFTSPPHLLPRVRSGASIAVGPLAGLFDPK